MTSPKPKSEACVFCKIASESTHKIYDTKNFFVIIDGAPLGPGHLLLIPKKHISCYGDLPKNLEDEFFLLKETVSAFIQKNYGRFILFEHGILGQTVYHAHLHFLPTKKKVLTYLNKTYKSGQIKDFSYLKDLFKKEKGYLFLQEDDKSYNILVKNVPAGFFHTYVLSKLLGVSDKFEERAKNAKKVFMQANKLWKDTVS